MSSSFAFSLLTIASLSVACGSTGSTGGGSSSSGASSGGSSSGGTSGGASSGGAACTAESTPESFKGSCTTTSLCEEFTGSGFADSSRITGGCSAAGGTYSATARCPDTVPGCLLNCGAEDELVVFLPASLGAELAKSTCTTDDKGTWLGN